ncbi:HPP family protein [Kitasatospora sp. NPDC088548]|uniref:CBS domain-containing protein n=1 Tax=Kitasatospora sp. NPDC088548 TaxID=3364075 RepID=UPI0038025646
MTVTLEHPTAATATVGDLMTRPELQISDDVMVDTAMDILRSSGADHALVRDEEGRCAGLLTRLHLAPFQARSWYTERTPVRDIVHDRAPFATADMPATVAAAAMRSRGLDAWPVVDHDGHVIGLLNLRAPSGPPRTGC